jgi:hypothetical protein
MNKKNNSWLRLLYLGLVVLLIFAFVLIAILMVPTFTQPALEDSRRYEVWSIGGGLLVVIVILLRLLQKWLGSTTPLTPPSAIPPVTKSPNENHIARAIKTVWFFAISSTLMIVYILSSPQFRAHLPSTFWSFRNIFFQAVLLVAPWIALCGFKNKNIIFIVSYTAYMVASGIWIFCYQSITGGLFLLALSYFLIRGTVSFLKIHKIPMPQSLDQG